MVNFNKRGVSEIVSYVLLISVTFAIAGIVYAWLVFYVTPGEEVKCKDDLEITIYSSDYDCAENTLNLTLQNKGLFDIDGYVIRLNNKSGAEIGIYVLNKTGTNISTGSIVNNYYGSNWKLANGNLLGGNITLIEVQPFKREDNLDIYCEGIVRKKISCD